MQTPLQARILEQLRLQLSDDLQCGDRINEAEVADQLGVSRTPIRRVLQKLQSEGVLDFEPRRGFILKDPASLLNGDNQTDELLDERVMRDMAIGELNTVFSERALMQRYSVPNGVLASTLRRLTRDHLVEPSPGRGWIFADVSPRAMEDSYRFRQIIEPAGILADSYKVDAAAFRDLDEDHADAIENVHRMDRRRLFDLDARFHKVVAQGAQTAELVSAIERQNNIRRVTEYIGFIRIERLRQSMIEHRGIIAALLEGNRQLAASLMHIHLQISRDETFAHMDHDLELLRGGKVRLSETDEAEDGGGRKTQ
ncbi:DNA-binding GntR family transcriptional regulator [Sinorhizobium kostiense]|uniref:DNA-binding GntR family transcriptional regulator n=1 Tax=Sinorhizobium kostiense TaxID=76747 RepID=A0ABS4R161_9HYPH|nr:MULTISPECIES: GntR family transcriptional regulator [Sinorhizobium]MBP2236635.1 DNA-binding GntR family transcriptional regulator [Sinorhizobium kostiense]